jgi:thiamine pyrophosphokinase
LKKCIILANGKAPEKSIINFFQQRDYNTLICADGGANTALKLNLNPDFIIGDLDSISKEAFKKFSKTSNIIKYRQQNDTDVEKCLKFAIKNKFDETLLIGVTGDRLDHTFCNLGIVLKFIDKISITLIAENSFLKPYKGNITLRSFQGEIISIYGFNRQTKITSKGLKYHLKNVALPFGERESTSNVSIAESVQLKIKNGIVFVIRDFFAMKKHDLFDI